MMRGKNNSNNQMKIEKKNMWKAKKRLVCMVVSRSKCPDCCSSFVRSFLSFSLALWQCVRACVCVCAHLCCHLHLDWNINSCIVHISRLKRMFKNLLCHFSLFFPPSVPLLLPPLSLALSVPLGSWCRTFPAPHSCADRYKAKIEGKRNPLPT